MPAVFGQTFLFISPISWHSGNKKMPFLRLIFDFFFFFFLGGGIFGYFRGKQLRQLKKRTAELS